MELENERMGVRIVVIQFDTCHPFFFNLFFFPPFTFVNESIESTYIEIAGLTHILPIEFLYN